MFNARFLNGYCLYEGHCRVGNCSLLYLVLSWCNLTTVDVEFYVPNKDLYERELWELLFSS